MKQSGWTLLEMLVALLLSTTILAISYPTIHSIIQTKKSFSEYSHDEWVLSVTKDTVEYVTKNAPYLAGVQTLYLIPNAKLISELQSGSTSPQNNSSALISIDVDITKAIRVIDSTASSTSFSATLCAPVGSQLADYEYWLTISQTGATFSKGSVSIGHDDCNGDIPLQLNNSFLSPPSFLSNSFSNFEKPLAVFPLNDILAIYLDTNNNLRYRSLLKSTNQTVVYGLHEFRITGSTLKIVVETKPNTKREATIELTNNIDGDYLDLI